LLENEACQRGCLFPAAGNVAFRNLALPVGRDCIAKAALMVAIRSRTPGANLLAENGEPITLATTVIRSQIAKTTQETVDDGRAGLL
jgi:hypothetical protein